MGLPSSFCLQANDRIVFLGDSITEQQLHTNYVETYLATRYPELKLTFFNAGWGGDTAPGGAQRLARDVLSLQPTVVTICYGMNDGRYCPPTEEIRAAYVGGMRELVARLKAASVRVVLLTPGMVDASVNPSLAKVEYNQRGLRILADEVLALAAAENLPVGDLHRLMNEVDAKAKAADPTFCMIPDSVHPDPAGQLVMAFGLLQALGVPPRRQEVVLDLAKKQATPSAGLAAGRPHRNEFGCSVEVKLDRLPFFVEPAARKVLPFLPFQETYNELKLVIRGMPAEFGSFRSERVRSAPLPRADFEAGINLFSQWSLAAVQKAADVLRFTAEKDQAYYKLWRILGLNGQNSVYHNAKAHAAGIRMVPQLDRAREKLLTGKAALSCRISLITADAAQAGEPLQDSDFITQWNLRGPFPKPHATDALGGEDAFTAQLPCLGSDWLGTDLDLGELGLNLIKVFGQQNDCFTYALTRLESPSEQAAELLIGSDDGVVVWLNGQRLLDHLDVNRGVAIDQERVPVQLRAGTNLLLLKISQGAGGWGFCARFSGLRRPLTAQRLA